jgi:hypothetical protein
MSSVIKLSPVFGRGWEQQGVRSFYGVSPLAGAGIANGDTGLFGVFSYQRLGATRCVEAMSNADLAATPQSSTYPTLTITSPTLNREESIKKNEKLRTQFRVVLMTRSIYGSGGR